MGVLIPLAPESQWKQYIFNGVPQNKITYDRKRLSIVVEKSASPIIHAFKAPKKVNHLKIKAKLIGSLPQLPKNKKQGRKDTDDYVLRVGLITKGDQKLNWFQRQLAPQWLIKMENQIPDPYGVKNVEFFTTCLSREDVDQRSSHYMNEILQQTCITHLQSEGEFTIEKQLSSPLNVIGIWVGSDGDQLNSQFTLEITEIEIR